jgi:hypothetical protein
MNPICATNDECESLVASIDFESGVPSHHSRVYSRMEEENCTGQRIITVVVNSALALASCHSS